jgi:hypothetical protein
VTRTLALLAVFATVFATVFVTVFVELALAAGTARAAETAVLVLHAAPNLAVEEARLVEALRIYTRDRDCRLVLEGDAPATPQAADVAPRARAAGAAIVSWVGRRGDGHAVYYVLTVAENDLRETEVEPLGPERAALDVALKVRALLSRPEPRAEPPRAADAAAEPPAPPAAEVERPREAPRAAPPEAIVERPAPGPAAVARERLSLGAAYGVWIPSDSAWMRSGLLLSLEVGLGHAAGVPLSVTVDGGFGGHPGQSVRGFDVALSDKPFGAGLLARGRWGPWGAAIGPRVGLHVLDVSADAPEGRAGASRRYAFGVGGQVRGELRVLSYLKIYLGATLEDLVPKQDFTLGGQPALSTGHTVASGMVGLVLLIL